MESEYFLDVVDKMNMDNYLINLKNDVLFIYSPTSLEKINFKNDNIIMENWHNISKDINKIEQYMKKLTNIKEIVTFGGGSTIDIGKYISFKLNIKHTCIPSMLSTNSYATNKVALIKNGEKITIDAKIPNKIIIDDYILKFSQKENLYGLADVLSIYTALYDWKIAKEDIDEKIDMKIFLKAENLLNELLEFINNNSLNNIKKNNMELFKFIGIAGYITNLYGSGRPESGSEHIFAKELEKNLDIHHGISVSLGIIIMTIMQERDEKEILKIIEKIEVLNNRKQFGVDKEIIKKCIENLKPRSDRYTIIDRQIKNNVYKKLNEFYEKI